MIAQIITAMAGAAGQGTADIIEAYPVTMEILMKRQILQPANFMLIIGLVFGIAISVLAPFGTGFDEEAHMARVYDLSGLNLLPNRSIYDKTIYFAEFHSLTYRRFYYRDQAVEMFQPEYFGVRANYDSMAIEPTMSIYPPLMFFPQAVVAGVGWRVLDLPIIPVALIMRVVTLSLYLFGSWLAIKIIPIGKWALLAVALLPTSLYQAATINGDGYTNAVSFLFISVVLAYALRDETRMTRREFIGLGAVIFLLGMAKPGAILLLPLLLLVPRKFFTSRGHWIGMWAVAVVMAVFHAGWILISFTNTSLGEGTPGTIFTSVFSQLGQYLGAFWRSFLIYWQQLFGSTIAAYGYWEGKVPALVYWLAGAVLVLALLAGEKHAKMTKGVRALLFGLMLLAWFGILVMYTAGKFTFDSKETVLMVQGRYLNAFLPLGLLALSGLAAQKLAEQLLLRWLMAAGVIVVQALFLWGLIAHYYTPCGPSALARTDCRLPAYQNLEIVKPPQVTLTAGMELEQGFDNTCKDLRSVELLIGDVSAGAQGALDMALIAPDGTTVVSRTVEVDALTPKGTLVLDVPEETAMGRGKFSIRLDGQSISGTMGVGIRTPDVYTGGGLIVDGNVVDGDVVFFYTCVPKGVIPGY